MSKRHPLRIIVAAIQAVLLVSACIWINTAGHFARRPETHVPYTFLPLNVVLRLNFPLLLAWFPILYATGNAPNGPLVIAVGRLGIPASVVLFWYFAVAEAEARSQGGSLIRFSNPAVEKLKEFFLFVVALAAIGAAFWDGHRLLHLAQVDPHHYDWESLVDAVIGEPLMIGWGVVLIRMAVRDLAYQGGSDL